MAASAAIREFAVERYLLDLGMQDLQWLGFDEADGLLSAVWNAGPSARSLKVPARCAEVDTIALLAHVLREAR
jgi:hypothetical protein